MKVTSNKSDRMPELVPGVGLKLQKTGELPDLVREGTIALLKYVPDGLSKLRKLLRWLPYG